MKNFKKVLALVLAIATLLSFATVASAKTADFADAKDVKNVEAVDVLSYIKVLEGYPADKSFKPAKNITREEAAKIIAIFANKSTDISSLYTSANPFADMKGRWGESYVAYGYRAGIIAGKNATSFVPKANVKGTEFLKMVLVVLGYDQNKEGLVGSSWAVNTLELAKVKGLLKGLDNFDANAALTRDQAAQIMLNALKAEKVVYGQTITNLTWNAKTGYWMTTNTAANAVYVSPNGAVNNYEHKLLAADFGLSLTDTQDAWGRPTHTWSKGTNTIGEYVDSDKLVKTYYTAVTECDVATDAGVKTTKNYKLFVNGNESADIIRATATTTKLGAQGRLTEVYTDRIVMIDTFLAKVDTVKDASYDAAGHKVSDAVITLKVYVQNVTDNTSASVQTVKMTSGSNFSYVAGDYVLLNAKTTGTVTSPRRDSYGAFAEKTVANVGNVLVYGEIAGKAETVEGAQSVIWFNTGKHTVEGTTYDDAAEFHLNEAQNKTTKHTWFKDSYGNLIGSVEVASVYSYGVVTKMYWEIGTAGSGKAVADVTYMDGTTNTVTVSKVNDKSTAWSYDNKFFGDKNSSTTYYVTPDASINAKLDNQNKDEIHGHLMQISTLADGTVAMTTVAKHLTGATIVAKMPYITTTSGETVKVDTNTKFLYRELDTNHTVEFSSTGLTYTKAEGMNEVPTFEAGTYIDVVVGNNGVADYVFVIGDTKAATLKNFVYVNSKEYSAVLKDAGNVKYWEITLSIPAADGSVATLKMLDQDGNAYTVPELLKKLTDVTSVGKLFYVTTKDGYVVSLTEISTATGNLTYKAGTADTDAVVATSATMPFAYDTTDMRAVKVAAGSAKLLNNAIRTNAGDFNVTDATTYVGELKADMTDKVLYVIYDSTNRVASKVYICDVAATPEGPYTKTSVTGLVVYAEKPTTGNKLGNIAVNAVYGGTEKASKDVVTYVATWIDNATGNACDPTTTALSGTSYSIQITAVQGVGDFEVADSLRVTYNGTKNFNNAVTGFYTFNDWT